MGILTLKIDNELESKLRRRAGRLHGARRGAISKSVESAISMWLEKKPNREIENEHSYVAKKNGKKIAEASSLELLSAKLRELNCDPRIVVIESAPPTPISRKMGFRTISRTIH